MCVHAGRGGVLGGGVADDNQHRQDTDKLQPVQRSLYNASDECVRPISGVVFCMGLAAT